MIQLAESGNNIIITNRSSDTAVPKKELTVSANGDFVDLVWGGTLKLSEKYTDVSLAAVYYASAELLRVAIVGAINTRTGDEHYHSWMATMSQTGTAAPATNNIFKNELPGTIVWTHYATGIYRGTLAGAFGTQTKFAYSLTRLSPIGQDYWLEVGFIDENNIQLTVFDAGNAADGILDNAFIELKVKTA